MKCTVLQLGKIKKIKVLGYSHLFGFASGHVDLNVEQLLVRKAVEDGITKVFVPVVLGFLCFRKLAHLLT